MKLPVYTPKFAVKLESAILAAFAGSTVTLSRTHSSDSERGQDYTLTVVSDTFTDKDAATRLSEVNKVIVDNLSEKMRSRIKNIVLYTVAEVPAPAVIEAPVVETAPVAETPVEAPAVETVVEATNPTVEVPTEEISTETIETTETVA